MTPFQSKTPTARAMIAAIFTVAVWAETFISSKILLGNGLMPADIFFFRFLLAYCCIWFISPKRLFAGSLKDEVKLALLGITGGSLYFLTENTALKLSTATNVSILLQGTPIITAILVALFYRDERMNGRQITGSLIAFIGMVLVVLNGQFVLHLNPAGDALALCASLTWGFYSLIMRSMRGKYDTRFITRKVFFYGLVTILPYFVFVSPLKLDWQILSRPAVWGNLIYLGLVASMLCFVLWNWVLAKLGTVRATNLLYGQCFFVMLIAHFVLGERITWMAVIGAVILILGMVTASWQQSRADIRK